MPTTRAYVSEYQLRVGPINVIGTLTNITRTNSQEHNRYVTVCPDCETPTPVEQRYICPTDPTHGPYRQRELTVKARDIGDGQLVKVDSEEVEAARRSVLPLNVFQATAHPRNEIETVTFPDDKAYVFTPRQTDEYFAVLYDLVETSDYAFVAVTNVRNSEGFFQLTTWNNCLVLQKLRWPSDVNHFTPAATVVKPELRDAALNMIERLASPFDQESYMNGLSTVKERLKALVEALEGNEPEKVSSQETVTNTPDLLALLNDFGK